MRKISFLHPLLFALYPLLFLYARNMEGGDIHILALSSLAALCVTFLLWALTRVVLRDGGKASLIVSCALILFFSYGQMYLLIVDRTISSFEIGRHRYLLLLWAGIFLLVCYYTARTRRDLKTATVFLNTAALILVGMALIQIGVKSIRLVSRNRRDRAYYEEVSTKTSPASPAAIQKPDIYYIILDGYAGSRSLREIYGFDNTEFITALREKGFLIPARSHSNYPLTYLSLASSLNMEYLDSPEISSCGGTTDCEDIFRRMIQSNRVEAFLKSRGYTIIAFASGFDMTNQDMLAEITYTAESSVTRFKQSLVTTSALVLLEKFFFIEDCRRLVLFNFEKLAQAARVTGPKFIFCHLMIPHPPYVFDSQGAPVYSNPLSEIPTWEKRQAYIEQLQYLNRRIEGLVETIRSVSETPPIIILQADHGSAALFVGKSWDDPSDEMVQERMDIFNAYHLPGEGRESLYDTITPVNTFRLILRAYFGADYELLEDKSYFSTYETPGRFTDVSGVIN